MNNAFAGNIQNAGKDFLRNFGANLGAVMSERTLTYLTKTHREGPARRKGLTNYIAAAYPDLPDRPLRKTWLTSVQASPEFQAAKIAVIAHDRAESDLSVEDPFKASQDIQPALGTPYAATPFVLNTEARIYAAKGDVTSADRLYDQGEVFGSATVTTPVVAPPPTHPARGRHGAHVRTPPPEPVAPIVTPALEPYLRQSVDGFSDHIDLLASHGSYDKASREIAAAQIRFGDREPFLPQLIFVSLKTNATETMMSAYGECQATENEGLVTLCRYAILDEDQKKLLAQMPPAQREKLDHMLARTGGTVQRANWLSEMTKAGNSHSNAGEPSAGTATTSQ